MIDFSKIKKLTVDGVDLKSLAINGVQVWKSGPKNWVKYSTEADGVTIYNGGLGYKDGYRVRSGGAEGSTEYATCTGFIPVSGLSVIRVKGDGTTFKSGSTANAINVYDASHTNLGQVVGNTGDGYGILSKDGAWKGYGAEKVVQRDGYWEWPVPPAESGVKFIRVTGATKMASTVVRAELIVTINEEIE